MKTLFVFLLIQTLSMPFIQAQSSKTLSMKMNAGIITSKLSETKKFYTEVLNFHVKFENEWFILLSTPDSSDDISFLMPQHPTQKPLFQTAFNGKGIYLTIEVENVDKMYQEIKAKKIPVAIELKDEPWGDRHFAIVDPNGVGIDIVTYQAVENK